MNTKTMTLERPVRTVNFAKILPPFFSATETALVPARQRSNQVAIATRRHAHAELAISRPCPRAAMERLETRELSVPKVSGTMSRVLGMTQLKNEGVADLKLPFGVPRFVNAATLKQMLNAPSSDILLKKSGERWEACDDSTRVDLLDDSIEFRLGAIQIFS